MRLIALVLAAATLSAPVCAGAQVIPVTTGEMTLLCARAAKAAVLDVGAARYCTAGIEHEENTPRQVAGLYVNRGVLRMRAENFADAAKDFETALGLDPELGEAWINRGAVRLAIGSADDALKDLDRGLALKPEEPEKGYFNRGLARERVDDVKGAYLDYRKAAELAPLWPPPQEELRRFKVRQKSDN